MSIKNIVFSAFIAILFISSSTFAHADEELYAPPAPAGSAFFRFVNIDNENATPSANQKSYKNVDPANVSSYFVIPHGDIIFNWGSEAKRALESGEYYSIISKNGEIIILQDQKPTTALKAMISFYNLTSKDKLTLEAEMGVKHFPVFKDVEKNKNAAREMNALKLPFVVMNADNEIATKLEPMNLERGQAYSVIAYEAADGTIKAFGVKGETDTTR